MALLGANAEVRAQLLVIESHLRRWFSRHQRGEDAKEKKSTMDTYWIPGVNHLGTYGRWAFAEFTDVYQMETEFNKIIASASKNPAEKQ